MKPIYLDYNATTPIDPRVAEAMLPYLEEHFGNPSSSHIFGTTARKAVLKARQQVAELLGAKPGEIIFTSGGTESNNWAIKGAARALRSRGSHIITAAIEHPAVMEVCKYLAAEGFTLTIIPVDATGRVNPHDIAAAITPDTILISIMHANNEVGTIQPIAKITEIAHENSIIMHTDAAQSMGKIAVNVADLGVDLLSLAGHKLYGPKGVGALYVRSGLILEKFMHGANHEGNRRAGTENVLEIVGLGAACELISQNLPDYRQHYSKMRDRLEQGLRQRIPRLRVNGNLEQRLPNTASISFKGLEANTILAELETVAASAGAACHAEAVELSAVLEAMAVPLEYAMGTIRFSVGRQTSAAEIDQALEEITAVIDRLRPGDTGASVIGEQGKPVKLTQFTHGLGCACKLRPQLLEQVLQKLPVSRDKHILVGADTADDAAVYKVRDDLALIQTVDFFTPIVDDPFQFGAIAAANSLSDIYAMGGKPAFALNIVGFPSKRLPVSVLEAILAGAQSKAEEAGIAIIGGHTVDDTEPKFGLAVTGFVHPDQIWRNQGARDGDVLVLTKPLGTGILSTAMKRGMLNGEQTDKLMQTMAELNANAAEKLSGLKVRACTDITGFGLCGHLLEMLGADGLVATLRMDDIPRLPGVEEMAAADMVPGGSRDNEAFTRKAVNYAATISEYRRYFVNDAQTSGGLLVALSEPDAQEYLDRMPGKAWVIGRIQAATDSGSRIHIN